MSLSSRLDAPFDVVLLSDPALLDLPVEMLAKYTESRNIEDLDLSLCADKPSIFSVSPLRQEYDHLIQLGMESITASARSIVKHHLNGARNYNDSKGLPIVVIEGAERGRPVVSDKSLQAMRFDSIQELAIVIVKASQRDSADPFSPPPSWRTEWARRKSFRDARRAIAANVKSLDTDTRKETLPLPNGGGTLVN